MQSNGWENALGKELYQGTASLQTLLLPFDFKDGQFFMFQHVKDEYYKK